jgi:hypothetical protein
LIAQRLAVKSKRPQIKAGVFRDLTHAQSISALLPLQGLFDRGTLFALKEAEVEVSRL